MNVRENISINVSVAVTCFSTEEPGTSNVKDLYPNFKIRSLTPSCEVQKKASAVSNGSSHYFV